MYSVVRRAKRLSIQSLWLRGSAMTQQEMGECILLSTEIVGKSADQV